MLTAILCLALPWAAEALPPATSTATSPPAAVHLADPIRRAVLARLPGATSLEPMAIAAELLDPVDRGNNVYYRVRADDGRIVGWARPLYGPVSTAGACPCNPLDLTLVFDVGPRLVAIEALAPLQKWGHQAMSDAEHQRLVALADQPPEALQRVNRGEDLLDMETGATQPAFAQVVVAQAGLSTHRIAAWVAQTRAILAGTPASADRRRVFEILRDEPRQPAATIERRLAALVPTMTDAQLQLQVYHHLAARYLDAQAAGRAADPSIEATLAAPRLRADHAAEEVALVAYEFVDRGLRLAWVRGVLDRVVADAGSSPFAQLLLGTERFLRRDYRGALTPLQLAATAMAPQNRPSLHLRLAETALALGDERKACGTAAMLYVHAPVLPGLDTILRRCPGRGASPGALAGELALQARAAFLRGGRPPAGARSRPLALRDLAGVEQAVPLARAGQVTVVMFFATWCPHCQMELPRVGAFAAAVQHDPLLRGRVATVGVRTAIDKESEPFAGFVARHRPTFPLWSDDDRSAALHQFAQDHHLPLALPTLAVLDGEGALRFLLEPGDWRDTARELQWAATALLEASPSPAGPSGG